MTPSACAEPLLDLPELPPRYIICMGRLLTARLAEARFSEVVDERVGSMPFATQCRGCERKLRIPDALVGKTVKCPHCARKMILRPSKRISQQTIRPHQALSAVASSGGVAGVQGRPCDVTQGTATQTSQTAKHRSEQRKSALPPLTRTSSRANRDDDEEARASKRRILLLALSLALLAGFGWWFFGRSDLCFVSGTIMLDGTPLGQAKVVFVADGAESGPFIAKTDDEGVYSMRTNTNEGIPPGKFKVTVSKAALSDGTLPEPKEYEKAVRSGALRNIVGKAYETPATTPLHVELVAGASTHNFEVKRGP
jgi:hypothetical protein